MPSLQFLNLFGSQLAKMSFLTSLPLSFLLIGLQAIMDTKFSCPCSPWWNIAISALILIAPAIFAFVIMLLLLRPCKYQCENCNLCKAFLICLIPCLVWICIFFIDGDFLACGLTYWKGRYACDKEKCLNWCKPNNLTAKENETYYYDKTQEYISISKTAGYGLAIFFCILAIMCCDCCKSRESAHLRSTDTENPRSLLSPDSDNMEMDNMNQVTAEHRT